MEEELDKALRSIWDNENFVYCITRILPTDDSKKKMIHAVRGQLVKDSSEAILYALAIYHNEPYEEFKRKIAKEYRIE